MYIINVLSMLSYVHTVQISRTQAAVLHPISYSIHSVVAIFFTSTKHCIYID